MIQRVGNPVLLLLLPLANVLFLSAYMKRISVLTGMIMSFLPPPLITRFVGLSRLESGNPVNVPEAISITV